MQIGENKAAKGQGIENPSYSFIQKHATAGMGKWRIDAISPRFALLVAGI